MTEREQAAFDCGIRHAADTALIAALTVEIRPDAQHVRQQAAIAALRGLAEALKAETINIAADPSAVRARDTGRNSV